MGRNKRPEEVGCVELSPSTEPSVRKGREDIVHTLLGGQPRHSPRPALTKSQACISAVTPWPLHPQPFQTLSFSVASLLMDGTRAGALQVPF